MYLRWKYGFKKGDLVENINQTKNRNIYIIVSIKENIYLGAKVIIEKDKATNLKWHYTLNDKDKILLIKYDNFSVLKTDSIKKSNYKINSNIYNLINKIYSLKEETKEERKIEHKKN